MEKIIKNLKIFFMFVIWLWAISPHVIWLSITPKSLYVESTDPVEVLPIIIVSLVILSLFYFSFIFNKKSKNQNTFNKFFKFRAFSWLFAFIIGIVAMSSVSFFKLPLSMYFVFAGSAMALHLYYIPLGFPNNRI